METEDHAKGAHGRVLEINVRKAKLISRTHLTSASLLAFRLSPTDTTASDPSIFHTEFIRICMLSGFPLDKKVGSSRTFWCLPSFSLDTYWVTGMGIVMASRISVKPDLQGGTERLG